MGQVLQFASPAPARDPRPVAKYPAAIGPPAGPTIRLTRPEKIAESVREKFEFAADIAEKHESAPDVRFVSLAGECGCRTCSNYRHLALNPVVQRILLELFG